VSETVRVVALLFVLVGLVACGSDSTGAGRPATTDLTLEEIAQSLRDADLGCFELWTDADDDLPEVIMAGECFVMAEGISIYVTDSRAA
jgi:protein involved in temperature-dependent protein secretion